MADQYYNLPFRFDLITNKGHGHQDSREARKLMCSFEDSLWNHIYLILTTPFKEVRYDPDFGCAIWEYDLIAGSEVNEIRWEGEIKDLIEDTIRLYEKRIEAVQIKVKLNRDGLRDAHKRLTVQVTGKVRALDRQHFSFQRDIIIAPFIAEHLH